MKKFDKEITLITRDFEDFDEMQEELYMKDMYIYQLDTYYLHNANKNEWYSIEFRYNYADIIRLFEEGKNIIFDEVKDDDLVQELAEILIG